MEVIFLEPQNTESAGGGNVEVRKSEKHFLLRHSLFDIRIQFNKQIPPKEAKKNYS